MANPADKYAKKTFGQLESQIAKAYRESYKDVSAKMKDFTRKHKAKDKRMQQDLKNGKITQEQYASWLRGQVFIGQQWQDMKASIDASIKNVMTTTASLTHDKSIDVFVDNANYTAFQIEKDHGFAGGINFQTYDRKTVSRLMAEDPELLPRKVVNGQKLEAWNTKIIANCVTQAIIQGESIDELSQRIARDTNIEAGRSSLLYARTAMTGAQNAGRVERMREAEDMGIKVQKQWMATLDSRTRDSHASLDGETVDVDEEFSNGLEYPGDFGGDPSEVYNCRCTLIYHYPEYSDPSKMERTAYYEEGDPEYDPDYRKYETVKGMNYEQWTNYKQDQIRQRYGGEAKTEKPKPAVKEDTPTGFVVSSDKELAEMRKQAKREDKELKALSDENTKLSQEYWKLKWEIGDIDKELALLDNEDLRMLDHLKSEEELKEYREQLSQECKELQDARASLQRPKRDDYNTTEEFEAAWDKYYKDKEDINGLLEDAYKELRTAYDHDWKDIERYRTARDNKDELERRKNEMVQRREEINARQSTIAEKQKELIANKDRMDEVKLVDKAIKDGVEYREPKSNLFGGTKPTTDEIVERLAGGDMTEGSCASVGFAYVGQKEGWDVLDFRGGTSEDFVSHNTRDILMGIAGETKKPVLIEGAYKEYTPGVKHNTGTVDAINIVKRMQEGNEYYLCTGAHAAIVRVVNDDVQYMELQSSWRNGWRPLGQLSNDSSLDRGFRSRFGNSPKSNGVAIAMDINDMKGSRTIHRVYGYVNTEEGKEKKGASGHER